MSQYRRILIGVVSLLLYSTVYGYTQPRYTLTDLGINAVRYFDSLSNDGIVAGSVWRTDVDAPAPALSDHGQVSTLPLSGNAYARNNVGQTVGDAFGGGGRPTVPLEWTAQSYRHWPVPGRTVSGSATAINDAGIGTCAFTLHFPPDNREVRLAARCNANGFTVLPDLGAGAAFPLAINMAGYVAGVVGTQPGRLDTMAVWTPNDQLLTYGPGTLYRMNDTGQFAGSSSASGQLRAIGGDLQSGPVPLPLPSGFVGSAAYDINTDGVRVGSATLPNQPPAPPIRHAIRWDADGTSADLNGAIDQAGGWLLTEAVSINDHGEILASATRSGVAGIRSVLLTPIPAGPSLALTVNQATFQPGQTLRVTLDLSNPGPILTTDVYVGVILPDGVNTLFLTNFSPLEGVMTTLNSDARTFARLLRNVSWPAGMRTTQHDYFTHTFTGLEPFGTYHFLVGWTKPNSLEDGRIDEGDVLALAWAPFTFTRGSTQALYATMRAIQAKHGK